MFRMMLDSVARVFFRVRLLLREIVISLRMDRVSAQSDGGIVYRGCKVFELFGLRDLYLQLNPEGSFSIVRVACYFFGGSKFIVVAQDPLTGQLVGMDMYYFNRRDLIENTVHEGFVGVRCVYEGRGIATRMRLLAKQYFKGNGFSGISTRISSDNTASLVSAKKIGFEVVNVLPEDSVASGCYYMVCDLESDW